MMCRNDSLNPCQSHTRIEKYLWCRFFFSSFNTQMMYNSDERASRLQLLLFTGLHKLPVPLSSSQDVDLYLNALLGWKQFKWELFKMVKQRRAVQTAPNPVDSLRCMVVGRSRSSVEHENSVEGRQIYYVGNRRKAGERPKRVPLPAAHTINLSFFNLVLVFRSVPALQDVSARINFLEGLTKARITAEPETLFLFLFWYWSLRHIHRLTTKPKSKQRGERAPRWFSLAAYLDETWCLFTTANCPMETLALLKTSAETNIIPSVVEESGQWGENLRFFVHQVLWFCARGPLCAVMFAQRFGRLQLNLAGSGPVCKPWFAWVKILVEESGEMATSRASC